MIKAEVGKFYVRFIAAHTYEYEPQEQRTIVKCETIKSEIVRNAELANYGKKIYLLKMVDELGGYQWEYNFDDNAPNLPESEAERTWHFAAIYSEASNEEIEEYKKNSELAKKEPAAECEESEFIPDFGYGKN